MHFEIVVEYLSGWVLSSTLEQRNVNTLRHAATISSFSFGRIKQDKHVTASNTNKTEVAFFQEVPITAGKNTSKMPPEVSGT